MNKTKVDLRSKEAKDTKLHGIKEGFLTLLFLKV